jgi:hypothetical protein
MIAVVACRPIMLAQNSAVRESSRVNAEELTGNCESARKLPLAKWSAFQRYDLNTVRIDIGTTKEE